MDILSRGDSIIASLKLCSTTQTYVYLWIVILKSEGFWLIKFICERTSLQYFQVGQILDKERNKIPIDLIPWEQCIKLLDE